MLETSLVAQWLRQTVLPVPGGHGFDTWWSGTKDHIPSGMAEKKKKKRKIH